MVTQRGPTMADQRQQFKTSCYVLFAIAAASMVLGSCNSGSQSFPPVSITSGRPPNGTVGTVYNFNLGATGGGGGYTWSWHAAQGSTLPAGLSVSMCDVLTPPGLGCSQPQAIAGTPTTAGTYKVVVTVSDVVLSGSDTESSPQSASATYTITIAP
jgi:hypothetical protein